MLHDQFVIKHLNDRMIFTGVILIASKYSNACFESYSGIQGFKLCVIHKITSRFTKQELKSKKINDLVNAFSNITIGTNPDDTTINELCNICASINKIIDANPLSNIDIMNIFFTEFNKYRAKSEHGQIFTPDHIASLMSKLINVNQKDVILDPTCGSGSLLIKASNLNHNQWENIYGSDFDMNVLFLSYINMLLHNDGITNLENFDALSPAFCEWIKNKQITKVIANPPYEKSGAIDILINVLDNVKSGCKVCWLMPNTKMDKIKKSRKILDRHTLTDIILLPDIFAKVGCGEVSLFIFTTGTKQQNQKIRGWWIEDDGFETVKNQGYKDVKHKWQKIEQEFLEKWETNQFNKEIDPKIQLSYPKDIKIEQVTKEDFEMTLLQWMLFNTGNISSQNTVQSTFKLMIEFMKVNNLDDKIKFLKKIAKEDNEK